MEQRLDQVLLTFPWKALKGAIHKSWIEQETQYHHPLPLLQGRHSLWQYSYPYNHFLKRSAFLSKEGVTSQCEIFALHLNSGLIRSMQMNSRKSISYLSSLSHNQGRAEAQAKSSSASKLLVSAIASMPPLSHWLLPLIPHVMGTGFSLLLLLAVVLGALPLFSIQDANSTFLPLL